MQVQLHGQWRAARLAVTRQDDAADGPFVSLPQRFVQHPEGPLRGQTIRQHVQVRPANSTGSTWRASMILS
jgi:hypothetical protein